MNDGDYFPGGDFIGQGSGDTAFDDARENFLLGFRKATARAYRADLESFREWCVEEKIHPLRANDEARLRYLRWLDEQGFSASTLARRSSVIRRFLQADDPCG